MSLANETLSTTGGKGTTVKKELYTDLNKLLANDADMDARLDACQTTAETAHNEIKGGT